jgi:chromosome segregation ATPase
MAWYENPNVIAALSGFLIAAVPAGLTARYAWRGKIAELQIGQTEKALMNLFSAHDNFIKELRSELTDKSQQIRDLQTSRAQLYKEIDDLHALRQSERRIYQEQIINVENKADEALDKLSVSERKARDCEAKCNELLLRIGNLENIISRTPPSSS